MAPRPPRRPGLLGSSALAALLTAVLAGSGGCEVLVGGDVPAFECVTGPAVCPGDQVCDQSSHQCVEPCSRTGCSAGLVCDSDTSTCVVPDAGPDDSPSPVEAAGTDADASMMPETTPPQEAAPPVESGCGGGLGCPCSGPTDCSSGICATPGKDVPTGFNDNTSFCTQTCCTSTDCGPGTVCLAASSATGAAASSAVGSYCVNPTLLSRGSALGTGIGGATCSSGRDCRSGLCSTAGYCADTCCSTAESSSSSTECDNSECRFDTFPGASTYDNGFTAWCGSGGQDPNGSTCSRNSDCQSELCTTPSGGSGFDQSTCNDACRSGTDCGGNGMSCVYVGVSAGTGSTVTIVAACVSGAGNKSDGATCSTDDECQSQFCDASGVCTDVCIDDSDCVASLPHCLPETVVIPNDSSSYTALVCSP